jgi:small neutral amino acid transporter SnatA (MarC family)
LDKAKNDRSGLLQIIASLIGGVIFVYLMTYVVWWVPNLAQVLEHLKNPLKESVLIRSLAIVTLTLIAFLFISLKKRLIGFFGFFEIVAGWWTIWMTFNQNFESNILYALAIGGGVFLLINGFENVNRQNELKKKKE